MNLQDDIPKYRKKSQKKGLSRSKHKHAYENCVFWKHERILDDAKGFIFGPEIEYSIGTYCPICHKIGTTYDRSWTVDQKDSIAFLSFIKTDWTETAKKEFNPETLPCFRLKDREFFQKFI